MKETPIAKDNQLGEIERNRLIKSIKRIRVNETHRQNERQNLRLKTKSQR